MAGVEAHIILTEDDIPEACLGEPLEKHTISQLRWWLLCRGTKALSSWKKKELIARKAYTFSTYLNLVPQDP